jgi:hypothetical protein
MAMRQRPRVTATRPVHEDFQPKSERKEEAAATVIVIPLPGVGGFFFFHEYIYLGKFQIN